MEVYNFYKEKKSIIEWFKTSYSFLCTYIIPLVFGVGLLYTVFTDYTIEWGALILAILCAIYSFVKFRRLFLYWMGPRLRSITISETGICLTYNKRPHELSIAWENIHRAEYFSGEIREGLDSTVEYSAYTNIYGLFVDRYNNSELTAVQILNDEWFCEEDKSIFELLMKFMKDRDRLVIV